MMIIDLTKRIFLTSMEEENDAAAGQQEISLSIEETNRLRAQLGLPPLKVPTPAELEARRAEKVFLSIHFFWT
jgi:hypothetical protein